MKTTLLSLIALLSVISSAHATHVTGQYVYFVDYNFSGFAYGRAVKSVMVHTAVLRGPSGCVGNTAPYWDSIQDVVMTPVDGHFFAQTRLAVAASECAPAVEGPIVQYWVTFADGTTWKTNSFSVPVTSSIDAGLNYVTVDPQIQATEKEKFDASTTEATYVDESFAD